MAEAFATMAMLGLVSIYCIVQALRDYRRGAYFMAVAGAACAILLLLIPIQGHAIKVDLPHGSP
jgi:hypothetical protein